LGGGLLGGFGDRVRAVEVGGEAASEVVEFLVGTWLEQAPAHAGSNMNGRRGGGNFKGEG